MKAKAQARTYTTTVLAQTDEELAAIAGLTRGHVRYYVATRRGSDLLTVSERADRVWSRLFVEVEADGATLRCECKRRRCCHRGAVRLWLRHRAEQAACRAANDRRTCA